MIYLKNNTEKQECFIPKNGEYVGKKTYKEGIEYQKSLLESITITENGAYSREDGYNNIIVDVPQEGGDINPDTLREITITENGRYTSKYSEPIKTGEFEDGTPFYGYAELNNMSYNTGILSENDTKVELWWCGDITQFDNPLIGQPLFKITIRNDAYTNCLNAEIYFTGVQKQNLESNVWYHIEFSKQEGFKINGELIGTFEDVGDVPNSNIYFNTLDGNKFANGKYGMLKINDTIFIPTENGFVNYANQEPMVVYSEGSYTYGTNDEVYEGEAYKTINVNIPPAKLQEKFEWRSDTTDSFTILPDEGYDGLSKVDVSIFYPLQIKYNEGYEAGKSEGGDCPELTTLDVTDNGTYEGAYNIVNVNVPQEGGSCDLEHLTITENGYYEPKAGEFGYLIVNENSAFDTGVKLVENSTIEILFNTGNFDGNIPTLIGCEDADWDNTTFAVRWFSGNLSIKVGSQEISIPMGAEDIYSKFHKLKFGRYEGVYLDDNYIEPFNNTEWTMNQNTIYIGAMHNPTNGDTNGVWRPWNGYIGDVKIYGEKNGEVKDYYFNCGDFGRWGEYETEGAILPNIMGEGGATFNCCKQYGDKPFDGYSSVSVNIDIEPFKEEGRNEVRNNLQSIEITENGRYSAEDQIYIKYLDYNGGYHTDTISTYDINRIEVTFKADTSESINGQGRPFILGGSLWGINEDSGGDIACARAIQYAYGRIVGFWEGKMTDAAGCMDGEWLTIILDENGMNVKYPTYETHSDYNYDNGNTNGGNDIFPFIIGGQGNRRDLEDGSYTSGLIEDSQFRGLIKEVKITTNSMGEITYIPKNSGYGVWDRKVENTGEYLSALEPTEGEVTFNGEYVKKYGEGWKEINVNVPTIQEQIRDYYYCPLIVASAGFGEVAKNWDENDVTINGFDGAVIEDVLYLPTFGNRNEFRTKEKSRFVQRIDIPSDSMGGLEFGDGVEYYVNNNEAHNYTNLTKIILGSDMETLNFSATDSFPALNEIWDYSTSSEFDVYFSIPNVKGGGILYLKNQSHESEWRNNLPEDWTIKYI